MFYRLLYYGFARYLPKSTAPLIGKLCGSIRRSICGKMFQKDETHQCRGLVVEKGAYFGNGKNFTVGNEVGIGKNFKSLNRVVTIDDYLMMGEDVLFLGGKHFFDRTDIPMEKKGTLHFISQEMYGLVHGLSFFLVAGVLVMGPSSVPALL